MEKKDYGKQLEDYQGLWRDIVKRFELYKGSTVKFGQGRLLASLESFEGKASQKDLMCKLCISAPSLTELLGKCEKSGYIVRQKDANDRRISIISMTDQGIEALNMHRNAKSSTSIEVFSLLNDEENLELSKLVNKLRNLICEKNSL